MADFPHFLLRDSRTPQRYTTTSSGGGKHESPPRPERKTHAEKLLSDLERAEKNAKSRQTTEPIREGLQFIPMRIAEGSDFDLELQRLESETLGIRIINAREVGNRKEYLVAVPDSQVSALADKFRAYRDEDTRWGKPKNEPLASGVSTIEAGELSDYWTEPGDKLPHVSDSLWWEIWLDSRTAEPDLDVEQWFRSIAEKQRITLSRERVRFPERVVVLAYASLAEWQQFPGLLTHLAEFRRANIVAGEFTRLTPAGQADYINDLLQRTQFADTNAVRICLLDTGVDRGHLLLESSLAPDHAQAWRDEWGVDDHHGHGTQMAGVCLFGPLNEPLYDGKPIVLSHRLESVKVWPRNGKNDPPDYGAITTGAMALAEAASPPDSQRVFCLATTAISDDQWRPTLWSAALDQACAGTLDGFRRLMVVSAGNLRDDVGKNYPTENHVSSIEDPAQAWNALTVGAYTNLVWMAEQGLEGYAPIARPGSLSPASRTSLCWGDEPWPYKPDVVFEGGNYAKDSKGFVTSAEDLEILTTQSVSNSTALLGTIRDTSAATAQAARMAAILQAEYPNFWPETIRGLIVHSAEWTPQMLEEFPRRERKNRLRVYGLGVPNLDRARRSAQGFATMVIQDQLQPFQRDGSENATCDMHLHELPIPREVLEELGNLQVRMRVTLSYFIEPNPPRRGYIAQYQYASHGLRFSVRRPQESRDQMLSRLSRDFWGVSEEGKSVRPTGTVSDDRNWDLGPETIAVRGSIHSDGWTGTAVQLASSNLIVIHPVTGWWRYRRDPDVVQKPARYSLAVSISTEEKSLNLYSAISNEIAIRATARSVTEIPGT